FYNRIVNDFEEEQKQNSQSMKSKEQNLLYLRNKIVQYKMQIDQLQKQLKQSGVTEKITHGELLKLSNQIEELKKKMKPKLDKLTTYHNLPPVFLWLDVIFNLLKIGQRTG